MSLITLTPRWTAHSELRGVTIYKRNQHTGTCCGVWLANATYFDTLKAAQAYVNALPLGQAIGNGKVVR
jgi:hypothetical protein